MRTVSCSIRLPPLLPPLQVPRPPSPQTVARAPCRARGAATDTIIITITMEVQAAVDRARVAPWNAEGSESDAHIP